MVNWLPLIEPFSVDFFIITAVFAFVAGMVWAILNPKDYK